MCLTIKIILRLLAITIIINSHLILKLKLLLAIIKVSFELELNEDYMEIKL